MMKQTKSLLNKKPQHSRQKIETIDAIHSYGISIDSREIFIAPNPSYIDGEELVDHWMANHFIRNITILNNLSDKPILVHSITCGGNWNYGMAIYDAIKLSKSPIVTLSHAYASSMSSIFIQSAKLRVLMPNTDFLIHHGTLTLSGNYTSVVSTMKWCEYIEDNMLKIYANKCQHGPYFKRKKYSFNQICEWLQEIMDRKQEVYLTPEEAKDYGFIDVVLGDKGYETIESLRANLV